jgi:hypothetical protein
MGSFCTPTYSPLPNSGETVEGTEIPAWVAAAGRTLFERSAELADSDYPDYTGARTATYGGDRLTEDERAGMSILREGAENYMPYMNRAGEVANTLGRGYDSMSRGELLGNYKGASRQNLLGNYQGASREELLGNYKGASRQDLLGNYQGASREELLGDPFSMETAQPFMDIYQSSMDPAVREIEEQTMRAQNDARARASTGGGGFGSRLGLMEAETAGRGAQAAGDLRAGAAREGLNFASGRYDTDRAARMATEQEMRSQFEQDRASRFGAEDTMRGQFAEDRAARFGAEDTMRGQFEQDRASRFGAEDVMRGQFAEDRAARFGVEDAARTGYETNEASRIQQMDAYQGMAPLISDLQRQAASGLISSGEAQRQLDQQALDLAYADYLDQREQPYEQLNFALGALSGTPYNRINRGYNLGTQMTANPSMFGQALAGAGGLYSAYRMARGQ